MCSLLGQQSFNIMPGNVRNTVKKTREMSSRLIFCPASVSWTSDKDLDLIGIILTSFIKQSTHIVHLRKATGSFSRRVVKLNGLNKSSKPRRSQKASLAHLQLHKAVDNLKGDIFKT